MYAKDVRHFQWVEDECKDNSRPRYDCDANAQWEEKLETQGLIDAARYSQGKDRLMRNASVTILLLLLNGWWLIWPWIKEGNTVVRGDRG